MKALESIDRFMYGAISLLMTILIAIGTWTVNKIIDHESRLTIIEQNHVVKSDLYGRDGIDKRIDRLEQKSGLKLAGVVHATEIK